jgi:hypothetical protein
MTAVHLRVGGGSVFGGSEKLSFYYFPPLGTGGADPIAVF